MGLEAIDPYKTHVFLLMLRTVEVVVLAVLSRMG